MLEVRLDGEDEAIDAGFSQLQDRIDGLFASREENVSLRQIDESSNFDVDNLPQMLAGVLQQQQIFSSAPKRDQWTQTEEKDKR